ncbi:hypothetical protein KY067_002530 [Listeria monocytogenes]|uniref:hypothetical protein n=1 Tax=Listeria monocytogenes TaxID=1639 RepID=UPI000E73B2B9|nr:hypothetical protein [Listeria monocytogenes]EAF6815805.1 hypothetical protein [Listeria monocytogenes]EAG4504461.1 hypothetical protein [Listeria monocytogenes]EHD1394972.1 hypothetical protein [Listeria monocytogenes]EHT9627383.1 hypothetical protein [Listeria monocytogenes]EKP7340237.1 hypothetical protein [Listeria monocytogenes]
MSELRVVLPAEEEKAFRSYIFNVVTDEFSKAKKEIGIGKEFWNSRKEIKSYLSIGDETLDRLIAKGMPSIRLGERGFHFHKQSVIDWLITEESGKTSGQAMSNRM